MIEPFVKVQAHNSLQARDQILLTLLKLRLDFTDLAYRFGVSPTTAATYFRNIV